MRLFFWNGIRSKGQFGPAEALAEEQAQRTGGLVEVGEAHLALDGEVALVAPEILRHDGVEGLANEAGEVPEHRDVDNLRPRAQATDGEGVRELLLEALHGFLLVANVRLGGSYASRADRRTSTSAAKRLWFNNLLQRTSAAQAMDARR